MSRYNFKIKYDLFRLGVYHSTHETKLSNVFNNYKAAKAAIRKEYNYHKDYKISIVKMERIP